MSLLEHAKRELALLGEDPEFVDMYLKVIEAFSSYGHSGGSASVAIPTINALLQFKNLTPLTDDPDEWNTVQDETPDHHGVWQSCRNAEAFSHDGGKTYYLLSEGGHDNNPYPLHATESAVSVGGETYYLLKEGDHDHETESVFTKGPPRIKSIITTGNAPREGADPFVDHPDHYNMHPSGVECIEIVRHMNFNLGNTMKYIWRDGLKEGVSIQDLEKAAWYLNDEIEKRKASC